MLNILKILMLQNMNQNELFLFGAQILGLKPIEKIQLLSNYLAEGLLQTCNMESITFSNFPEYLFCRLFCSESLKPLRQLCHAWPLKGIYIFSIIYKIEIPRLKISQAKRSMTLVQRLSNYLAMYLESPQFTSFLLETSLLRPRSPILQWLLADIRMFQGFMSRCTIFYLWRRASPLSKSLIILMILFQQKQSSSAALSHIYFFRLEGQYSIAMYSPSYSIQAQKYLTINQPPQSLVEILAKVLTSFRAEEVQVLMCFRAQVFWSNIFLHYKTYPKCPHPNLLMHSYSDQNLLGVVDRMLEQKKDKFVFFEGLFKADNSTKLIALFFFLGVAISLIYLVYLVGLSGFSPLNSQLSLSRSLSLRKSYLENNSYFFIQISNLMDRQIKLNFMIKHHKLQALSLHLSLLTTLPQLKKKIADSIEVPQNDILLFYGMNDINRQFNIFQLKNKFRLQAEDVIFVVPAKLLQKSDEILF